MGLMKNKKGFVFTLDGVLALFITLSVVVGIAQIGDPSTGYRQFGRLQLERYADDGLRTLGLSDITSQAILLENQGKSGEAREILRHNLREFLPEEIQFKMMIGREDNVLLDNVYPTSDNKLWENALENANERVVTAQVTIRTQEPRGVILYVWRGENVG